MKIEPLLKGIARQDEDSFRQLCALYGDLVYRACKYACSGTKGFSIKKEEEIEDLVQEIWIKIFQNAESLSLILADNTADEKTRFFSWIATVAANIKRQEYRHGKVIALEFFEDMRIIEDIVPPALEQPLTVQQLLQETIFEYLHSLSELEAEVMWTTYEHPKRVPNSVMKGIREKFRTTSANIRQIRHRVRIEIKKLVLTKAAQFGKPLKDK